MRMTKTLVFYLPQFHEIPENDMWWGRGYTDWTAVKNSEPLFFSHYQPTEPLDDNYYDLTETSVLNWQAELAKNANIYGFCFYHYWFGKKILLKTPAENLLAHKEIDMKFCFSWANETWKRTWSREEGNDWNEAYDNKMKCNQSSILIRQEYGDRREWIKHFDYLLQFFQDDRYIKVDNRPVFILYKPKNIKCLHSMMKLWNFMAREYGFNGMYIIGTNELSLQNRYIDANLIYEPAYTFQNKNNTFQICIQNHILDMRNKGKKVPQLCSYSAAWRNILKRNLPDERKTYLGGFVKFDNTPRRGKNAWIYVGVTPYKFQKYFERLVLKSNERDNEFLFLTAWNEWGEGAYLEPDKRNGYQYLNMIHKVMQKLEG